MDSKIPERPTLVVVVLDCMRASDFPGYSGAQANTPCLTSLLGESSLFSRAVTPAPWTIPAHASLFSGMYPWEHGTHARASLVMNPSVPRLPEVLRDHGYATFALSANPLIEPTFNLVQGFDRAWWGRWWESFLRIGPANSGSSPSRGPSEPDVRRPMRRGGLSDRILHSAMQKAFRFTFLLDGANRIAQRLRPPEPGLELAVAPWIEGMLGRWLSETPPDKPVFAFVNLVDTHEPYYLNAEVVKGFSNWMEYARCRQDYIPFLNGEWEADASSMDLLHRLYVSQLGVVDRRISRLIGLLKQSGRWENTLLVVTSDHGQSFGERGVLFHMIRPDETLLRIPLVVRFPDRREAKVIDEWASLIDIVPTLLSAAGIQGQRMGPGVPLQTLLHGSRVDPVLATADGIVWGHQRSMISASRRDSLDHTFGVAYKGDWKVIVDGTTGSTYAFEIASDPGEEHNRWDPLDPQLGELRSIAQSVADRTQVASAASVSADVEERLKSWGYL